MTQVNKVKCARRDYPEEGIKKGESYYWWKFRHGPRMMSKSYPKKSQITQNPHLAKLYKAIETYHETVEAAESIDDVVTILNYIAEAITACHERSETLEKVLRDMRGLAEDLEEDQQLEEGELLTDIVAEERLEQAKKLAKAIKIEGVEG